ncbi:MAG: indolepyruvate ferredoxin oxidoreductase beta subunit [Paracoccaceae bacterium]|jgi:indolepyruvate ferredoxin oxidoreductase beta subunit
MSGSIIKLAIMAVGGQGGGVLTTWIETMARAHGFAVQATSVAGVAQRTGATIYYIEMAPMTKRLPVFALAPAAGDVDILIAAELMEAGRALIRGFVTPDRTTLIASSHRALAVSEKSAPGDGIADSAEVVAAAGLASKKLVLLDLEAIAKDAGSVISASLFGALAASGALPFEQGAFKDAIQNTGKNVDGSLRAFYAGYDAALGEKTDQAVTSVKEMAVKGPARLLDQWAELLSLIDAMPSETRDLTLRGLRKVVDFQDLAYGRAYLDRVREILAFDQSTQDFRLTCAAAKHVANAMAYDDVIKVADLKTRASRDKRVRAEMSVDDNTVLQITEYMHPGAVEIVGLLPARLGAWAEASPRMMSAITRVFGKSRRLRSDGLFAFTQLYCLGGLRRWRLISRRHAIETEHLDRWLTTAKSYLPDQYDLAVEVLNTRRLIKGYSDTHVRGLSKFDRVLSGITLVATRKDGADWARRLIEAALKDEKGEALDGAVDTINSFS